MAPLRLVFFALLLLSIDWTESQDVETSMCSPEKMIDRVCEVEDARFRNAELESRLDERSGDIDEKNRYLRECEKKIEELNLEINRLNAVISSLGGDSSRTSERIDAIEEEIRHLWAISRKNNFEIYTLEQKALNTEQKLTEISHEIEQMAEIVSEQWIQIQKLEQAVHMAELRTLKIKGKYGWKNCPFMKSSSSLVYHYYHKLKTILHPYTPSKWHKLDIFKSKALQLFSSAKYYHHSLQGCIKLAMKSNEFTALLAHDEVVFFMASTLATVPLMAASMILLSQFHRPDAHR